MGYKRKGATGEIPHPKRLQKDTTLDGRSGKPMASYVREIADSNRNGRSDI